MSALYVVRPRPAGDGYTLSGAGMPYPLWFLDDAHAADMAHHHGRHRGGRVVVLDSGGNHVITETIEQHEDNTRPSGLH